MSTSNDNPFRAAGSSARKLRFGTFEVDLQERELRNRGIRLRLQHKPFQILELLLERRGALVTRTELARHLWPNLHVSFDHGLNTAVNTLRETLGDSTRSPRFIETRSGLGYRFVAPVEEIWDSEPARVSAAQNDGSRAARHHRPSFEAYQDYSRGKFFSGRMKEADLRKSVACFESAIGQDPKYALAYSGLADVYSLFAQLGMLPSADAGRRAEELATAALQMDEGLPEAHAALGDAKKLFDWDYAAAEKDYLRALELDPNYADGHHRYASLLAATGRVEQAVSEVRRAMELDPLSLSISVELAWIHYIARDFDSAMRQSWKTLVLEPTFAPAQNTLGLAYEQLEMYEEAITELQNACVCSDHHPAAIAALGHAHASAGRQEEAAAAVRELELMSQSRHVSSYWRSIACLGLDRIDDALDWIEKACEEHDVWLVWLKAEPRFDAIRSDARFDRALRELGLRSRVRANGL
jgi:DNA-binding winged helix-turn-helix (wHTH) protein/Flp pilus assembly protein TadD